MTSFILEKIGVKFNAHKLKPYLDFSFILAEKIIVRLDKLMSFYLDFYVDMVNNEIKSLDIKKDDKVLQIGCGPIPATCILISKKTKAHATGIDKNKKSVIQAKNIVKNIGLKKKIDIKYADVNKNLIKDNDLIIISQGIKPYYESIKYISNKIDSNSKILLRTSSDPDGNLVKRDFFLSDLFNVKKIIRHKKNGLLISILLEKK